MGIGRFFAYTGATIALTTAIGGCMFLFLAARLSDIQESDKRYKKAVTDIVRRIHQLYMSDVNYRFFNAEERSAVVEPVARIVVGKWVESIDEDYRPSIFDYAMLSIPKICEEE